MTVYFTFSTVLLGEYNNNMNCSVSFYLLLFHQSYYFSPCHHHYPPSYFKNSNIYVSLMELFGNFRLVSDRFSRLITFTLHTPNSLQSLSINRASLKLSPICRAVLAKRLIRPPTHYFIYLKNF